MAATAVAPWAGAAPAEVLGGYSLVFAVLASLSAAAALLALGTMPTRPTDRAALQPGMVPG